ncbi:MAG: carbohydrate binding family 9 domain-containing protein [Salinivirgaceae bacterium]|nr:carbohydrate binding family 9 domain-containing protein [Salinivirgaceae bacterium]
MKRSAAVFICLLLYAAMASGALDKREYETKKIDLPITIDGTIDEASWKNAQWLEDFHMYYPYDNKEASQHTTFAILYDENFVYVAIKANDNHPEKIVKRLTRKDELDGDWIGIQFDSYNDLQTAYCFNVSAAGTKRDVFISGDGDVSDDSYNPIWWVETTITSEGWVAEMKIPFSQFRFINSYEQTWGVQVERYIQRMEERSLWQPKKRDDPGWVHHYGKMNGLVDIQAKKVLDLYPYVVGGLETYEKEEGNPYRDGLDAITNYGLDGKIGLTNNLTLDFTINPDFGQVEADPANVNLSGFELFFPEKRPFFIEGNSILSFPLMFGDGDLANDNLFYSRRIGRSPHYDPANDSTFSSIPNNTTILGAAKITGRTDKGLSIGIMESVTAKEKAKYTMNDTETGKLTAEPLTNYSMVSLRQDFNNGNALLGGTFTSVNRNIEDTHLDYLHKNAYSGGLDFTKYWKDKTWFFTAKGVFSHVNGNENALYETQTSSTHNFQRPDADHVSLDTSATSLSGYGGNINFGKSGGGKVSFVSAVYFKSPGLELNDMGYVRHVDDIITINWMGYRINEPFSIFKNVGLNFNHWSSFDFSGKYLGMGGNTNMYGTFKNNYEMSFGVNLNTKEISTSHLHGGPSYHLPGSTNQWIWAGSDARKKVRITANVSFSNGFYKYYYSQWYSVGISYKPIDMVELSINPSYNPSNNKQQYVWEANDESPNNYVLATLDRKTFNASVRANLNITPDLSFQLWAQPYFSSGEYSNYKHVIDADNSNYEDRFMMLSKGKDISFDSENDIYNVDVEKSGSNAYSFSNPNFNEKYFLMNFVARWEYRPGSVLFFVWSQNRGHSGALASQSFGNDVSDIWQENSNHTFLVKLSYRIGI